MKAGGGAASHGRTERISRVLKRLVVILFAALFLVQFKKCLDKYNGEKVKGVGGGGLHTPPGDVAQWIPTSIGITRATPTATPLVVISGGVKIWLR